MGTDRMVKRGPFKFGRSGVAKKDRRWVLVLFRADGLPGPWRPNRPSLVPSHRMDAAPLTAAAAADEAGEEGILKHFGTLCADGSWRSLREPHRIVLTTLSFEWNLTLMGCAKY